MRALILLIMTILAVSCTTVPERLPYEPEVVVEGWIEQDGGATVILSKLIEMDQILDEETMADIPIVWGSVKLISHSSDGECDTVQMVGGRDTTQFLQYRYRTYHVEAQADCDYTIVAQYSGRTVTATTHLLPRVEVEQLRSEVVSPEKYALKCTVVDPSPEQENYYMAHVKVHDDMLTFYPAILGVWSDSTLAKTAHEATIYRPLVVIQLMDEPLDPFFVKSERVEVRFSQIDRTSYDYWLDYQESIVGRGNIIYPSDFNLKSNVNGGLGCWYGLGSSYYTTTIQ